MDYPNTQEKILLHNNLKAPGFWFSLKSSHPNIQILHDPPADNRIALILADLGLYERRLLGVDGRAMIGS